MSNIHSDSDSEDERHSLMSVALKTLICNRRELSLVEARAKILEKEVEILNKNQQQHRLTNDNLPLLEDGEEEDSVDPDVYEQCLNIAKSWPAEKRGDAVPLEKELGTETIHWPFPENKVFVNREFLEDLVEESDGLTDRVDSDSLPETVVDVLVANKDLMVDLLSEVQDFTQRVYPAYLAAKDNTRKAYNSIKRKAVELAVRQHVWYETTDGWLCSWCSVRYKPEEVQPINFHELPNILQGYVCPNCPLGSEAEAEEAEAQEFRLRLRKKRRKTSV